MTLPYEYDHFLPQTPQQSAEEHAQRGGFARCAVAACADGDIDVPKGDRSVEMPAKRLHRWRDQGRQHVPYLDRLGSSRPRPANRQGTVVLAATSRLHTGMGEPSGVRLAVGPVRRRQSRVFNVGLQEILPAQVIHGRAVDAAGHAFTSNCNPFNLYCEMATKKIKEITHNPKIIVSVRDPVDRAYSD